MSAFDPVAIVGRSCVLPGATTPEELFVASLERRCLLTPTPAGRWRGLDPQHLKRSTEPGARVASATGGYVDAFDVLAPAAEAGIAAFRQLDPLVHWIAHCAHAALGERQTARTGLIVGNLSYPTSAAAALVENYWRGDLQGDPRNRFSSGLPVHLVAQAMALRGPAFALDAACASSLYAIKLACDALHDGEADIMLAGGVNRADDLFLHLGFTSLQALSPSGQSRPFDVAADGLVPCEGAALVALKRLADAERDGDRIFGVIRGIGLSNDGRQNGFLAPSAAGQVRAIEEAFAQSGWTPRDVAFVDCHATGTVRGDATEIESLAAAYGDVRLKLGALKANIGHAITASGAASLVNVLSAMDAGVMPPALCRTSLPQVQDAGFVLPSQANSWDGEIRRAAISNFGFGGNNAHLLVESHHPSRQRRRQRSTKSADKIAICAVAVRLGDAEDTAAFRRQLFSGQHDTRRMGDVTLDMAGLGFPPSDLRAALSQQTAMLAASGEALSRIVAAAPERAGVIIGMGCDATIARHGLRLQESEAWKARNAEAAPALTPEGVLGTMPNIPANRIHAQRDFQGFGFTVANEELSGLTAMKLGARALRAHELDVVVVGAVDMSCEPAHQHAAQGVGISASQADAAVAFVLKRLTDAVRDSERVIGVLGDAQCELATGALSGHAHAAVGAVRMAEELLALEARVQVDGAGSQPAPGRLHGGIEVTSFSGAVDRVVFDGPDRSRPSALAPPPVYARFAAANAEELRNCIEADAWGHDGGVRCALVAETASALEMLRERVLRQLKDGQTPAGPGVIYAASAMQGELAFAFTGAAAAYPGAGRELLLAWPEVGDALAVRHAGVGKIARSLYGADTKELPPRAQLTGCALVCQAHAEFSRSVLALNPTAAIGLSSGETNALLAFGVWRDLDAMLEEIDKSGLYGEQLTGACRSAARVWGRTEGDAAAWECWRIAAPRAVVEDALAGEPEAYMTIVQAEDDCVIGGAPDACRRVVDKAGRTRAMPLGLDMVVHCAAMEPFAETWRRIHTREVFEASNVRFYSNAENKAYTPTRQAAAQAITQQAREPIDFPKTVRQAWDDGVRIFVEHGPRAILGGAIAKILEGKPHLVVSLDATERRGLRALTENVFKLWAHQVDIELGAFDDRMDQLRADWQMTGSTSRKLVLPAHPPDIVAVTEQEESVAETIVEAGQMMPEAPAQLARLYVLDTGPPENSRSQARALTPASGRSAAAMRLISSVSETHSRYVEQQAAAHAAFLQTRARLVEAVSRGRPSPSAIGALTPTTVSAEARILYGRADLEKLAGGKISDIFGPLFAQQDGYKRQVRMPQPPLLLADRVMLIEGEPGSMGKGRIVTETDVDSEAWYMHSGRMSPGVVIESGQADLLLASWLGADFQNKGERVYRLLGCDLTFMGELPKGGETLRYDIHIDGHAQTGDTRLFFFHYDCYIGDRLMISVRNGQAGFFSDAELSQSGGVLWDAATDAPKHDAQWSLPTGVTRKRAFTREEVDAFAAGSAYRCFGEGFEMAAAHVRTPSIPTGQLRLIDDVEIFEPDGGPWGRGYLRARAHVPRDAWFYSGHFKDDPCMPGTLMADAATQTLAFAMAAYGFTIDRDGWRFEPVAGETAKFVCRGQVTPEEAHDLEYEVFIEEIIDGPTPTIFASLLCRSDGFKVFHCRRFGMRLAPDWPMPAGVGGVKRIVGAASDVRGDIGALLACARGKPSDAFGALYVPFDGVRRAPRLPGDPYHFVSRIMSVDGPPGQPNAGASVIAEYDAPPDAWYFADGGSDAVPLSVLTEVLLQPCGWLASYMGFAASRAEDVAFRNLDGADVLLAKPARAGVLRVTARLERFAEAGGSTIVFFHVLCTQGGDLVMSMRTAFGFFSPQALKAQVGLQTAVVTPAKEGARAFDWSHESLRGAPALSRGRLQLIDRVTGYEVDGGGAGLGRLSAGARVEPEAWFFKAHFFQDPVQPGSLGLEAIQQAGRALIRLKVADTDTVGMQFEPIACGAAFSWKFRGQVVPTNRSTQVEVEVQSLERDARGVLARINGEFHVDGLRIYEVRGMGVRLGQ